MSTILQCREWFAQHSTKLVPEVQIRFRMLLDEAERLDTAWENASQRYENWHLADQRAIDTLTDQKTILVTALKEVYAQLHGGGVQAARMIIEGVIGD